MRPDDEPFPTCHCGGGLFGASILTIKEMVQSGKVTDMPLMPSAIRGAINLRRAGD
jgi:chemotaxis signal transduction protein